MHSCPHSMTSDQITHLIAVKPGIGSTHTDYCSSQHPQHLSSWPFEDSFVVPVGWKYLAWSRECPQSDAYALIQQLIDGVFSSINRTRKSKEKKWEGLLSLLIPESLLAKFLLPVSVTLGSISARKLSSQRKRRFPLGAAVKVLLNWQMRLATLSLGPHASEIS